MKMLGVALTLCTILTLSQAGPINSTVSMYDKGMCEYKKKACEEAAEAFCPMCDDHGNYLPKQCWSVDVYTGDELHGKMSADCEKHSYCPDGWYYYEHRCFKFIEAPKTWIEAEIYCQYEGGNLASIHTYEECHFIKGLTKGDTHSFPETWIGGFDSMKVGFWMWCDGTKFYFNDWCDEDQNVDTKRCLMMNYQYDLKWAAATCSDLLPFVCSKMIYTHDW